MHGNKHKKGQKVKLKGYNTKFLIPMRDKKLDISYTSSGDPKKDLKIGAKKFLGNKNKINKKKLVNNVKLAKKFRQEQVRKGKMRKGLFEK